MRYPEYKERWKQRARAAAWRINQAEWFAKHKREIAECIARPVTTQSQWADQRQPSLRARAADLWFRFNTSPWATAAAAYGLFVLVCLVSYVVSVVLSPARADDWTGPDKLKHAAAGAIIGAAVTAATDSPAKGCAAGAGVGVLKEAYDAAGHGTPSFKDAAVTAALACVSAYAAHWAITPRVVYFRKDF